jgi:O-antigen ligase
MHGIDHDFARSLETRASAVRSQGRSSEKPRLIDPPAPPQRFLLGLCLALAATAPLCLYLGIRGFAPVVGIAGFLCLPLGRPTREDWNGMLILAALVAWAAFSIIWSPALNLREFDSAKAFEHFTIGHMALLLALCPALIAGLGRLDGVSARKALRWIAYGFLVATPLLIGEGLTGIKLYPILLALAHQRIRLDRLIADLAQAGYVVAVMAWPLGVALFRQGRPRLALVLAAFTPLSMMVLRGVAPTVALGVSLASFFLVLRRGARGSGFLAVLTAAYLLAVPLVMLAVDHLQLYAHLNADLPPSWSDRLRIWSFVAEQLVGTFPRGAGLDASRTFPGFIPLHPHSAPLQVCYELGLPGAVLEIWFWLWLWKRISDCARQDRLYGATAAATATAYLAISAVSFGQWQAWWLAVGGLAVALCVLLGKTLGQGTEPELDRANRPRRSSLSPSPRFGQVPLEDTRAVSEVSALD